MVYFSSLFRSLLSSSFYGLWKYPLSFLSRQSSVLLSPSLNCYLASKSSRLIGRWGGPGPNGTPPNLTTPALLRAHSNAFFVHNGLQWLDEGVFTPYPIHEASLRISQVVTRYAIANPWATDNPAMGNWIRGCTLPPLIEHHLMLHLAGATKPEVGSLLTPFLLFLFSFHSSFL